MKHQKHTFNMIFINCFQVKKVKSYKEENHDSNASRKDYNPFQLFQDRNRDQKHHHKPDHFKNNHSHNRYGYHGHRGKGFRGGGGGRRGGSSDHHKSKSQAWRRFR